MCGGDVSCIQHHGGLPVRSKPGGIFSITLDHEALTAPPNTYLNSYFFQSFCRFFEVFASFLKFSDMFGTVRTCSDPLGRIRIHSDAYGCVRMRLDDSGKFQKNLDLVIIFWRF